MNITSDELCAAMQAMFPKEFEIAYRRLENQKLQERLAELEKGQEDGE